MRKNARYEYVRFTEELVDRAAKEDRPLTPEEEDLVEHYRKQIVAIDATEALLRPSGSSISVTRTSSEQGGAS